MACWSLVPGAAGVLIDDDFDLLSGASAHHENKTEGDDRKASADFHSLSGHALATKFKGRTGDARLPESERRFLKLRN